MKTETGLKSPGPEAERRFRIGLANRGKRGIMIKKRLFCLMAFLLVVLPLAAGGIMDSLGKSEGEGEPTIQELYGELAEDLPVVGFLKPLPLPGGDGDLMGRLLRDVTESMVYRGSLKPASLEEWYSLAYKEAPPRDILEINEAVVEAEIPLDYTASINLTPFDKGYLFRLAFYVPGKPDRTVYVYRILENLEEEWNKRLPGMLDELDNRLGKRNYSHVCDRIYIEPFDLHFFDYFELENGDFTFTELPFFTLDGRDYRKGDDLFSEWLGLRLHLSGYFPVVIHDLRGRVAAESTRRPGCTWGIRGEVRISQVLSVLRLSVYNYPRQETVEVYDIPFRGLDMASVASLLDKTLPYVMDRILSNEARRSMTVISPDFSHKEGSQIYTEWGYQGPGEFIGAYPARVGINRYLVVKDDFSPVDMSGFNEALLVGPDGTVFSTFVDKEIHYVEKLLE